MSFTLANAIIKSVQDAVFGFFEAFTGPGGLPHWFDWILEWMLYDWMTNFIDTMFPHP